MKIVSILTIASIPILTFVLSSCKNSVDNPIGDIKFPSSNVSYKEQVQPLFNVGCIYSGCHDQRTPDNGNLSLTNYIDATTDDPGVIIKGNPTNSILIQRIKGQGGLMPPSSPLNENQIQGLTTWIQEGGKNN